MQVIYCASSTLTIANDMIRVDQQGVSNMSNAFLNVKHTSARRSSTKSSVVKKEIAKFRKPDVQESWDLLQLGPPVEKGTKTSAYKGQDFGNAMISTDLKRLEFSGESSVTCCGVR